MPPTDDGPRPGDVEVVLTDAPAHDDVEALRRGLDAAVPDGVAPHGEMALGVFARGADGRVLGGLYGATGWNWLSIRLLWVDAALRGRGVGRDLVARAEAEARHRGCRFAQVDTMSFQAPAFYRALGYRLWGELPDHPPPHRRHFFMKPLRGTAPGAGATEPAALQSIPLIETERLLLRGLRAGDLDEVARLNADPAFVRHLGHHPMSREDSWRQLAMFLGHWQLRGYGFWAVEEKASGRCIGRIGCHEPEGWPAFEVAWALDPAVWGRGLATEGGRAALDFAQRGLGRREVISVVHPENAASIRVAEKLGGRLARRETVRGIEVLIYRYPPPDAA